MQLAGWMLGWMWERRWLESQAAAAGVAAAAAACGPLGRCLGGVELAWNASGQVGAGRSGLVMLLKPSVAGGGKLVASFCRGKIQTALVHRSWQRLGMGLGSPHPDLQPVAAAPSAASVLSCRS